MSMPIQVKATAATQRELDAIKANGMPPLNDPQILTFEVDGTEKDYLVYFDPSDRSCEVIATGGLYKSLATGAVYRHLTDFFSQSST